MDKVFVIQVARYVWREGCEHLINLPGKSQGEKVAQKGFVAGAGRRAGGSVGMEGVGGWQRVGRSSYLFLGKPLTLRHQHFFDAANKRAW